MGYTKNFIKGVSWIWAFRAISRISSFGKIIVIARILDPSQFGLFGIAILTLSLLELATETGVNILLVQTKNKLEEMINSAWVVSIIRGIAVALLMVIAAPFIASFFRVEDARNLIFLLSLVPFIRGFINPAEALFQKELRFREEFWLRSTVFLFDVVVAILATIILRSPYGLVAGIISGAILEVILSFIWFKLKPKFTLKVWYIKEIIHKGKWVTAFGILNYLSMNGDNILVGKLFGPASLGIYQMAYSISILPISEISDVANKVSFPIFAKIEQDRGRLIKAFSKTMILVTVPSFIIAIFLFVFSKELILLTVGEKWISAIPILRALAVYGFLRSISGPSAALFLAIEKQKYVTVMNSVKVLVMFSSIMPLAMKFGIMGVAYSVILSAIVEIPVIIYYLFKIR